MIKPSIARRYARGLFAVGEKDGHYKKYFDEMSHFLKTLDEEPRLRWALMVPLMEMDKRKEILADVVRILGLSAGFASLLSLLLDRNKVEYLPVIRAQYEQMLDDKEGRVRGSVYSAFPLSHEAKQRIEEALTQRMNKKVELSAHEDRGLIGGVKVIIGGLRIDGTVRRQFEMLNESILKE